LPYVSSLPSDATPLLVYKKYPHIYEHWSKMSEAIMNGPSPFSQAERELLFSYAAGVAGCEFVCIAHSEVAYARGIERGLVEALLEDARRARVDARLRPVLELVRMLMLQPSGVAQSDVDAVFAAGWNEQALNDAVAIAGRAAYMQRIVGAYGLVPMSREEAAQHAHKRVRLGYVNVVNGGKT
jgi:alkylhydroperoxidase family enzyme